MQHLEGSGTPVLYIGRTVLKSEDIFLGSPTISHLVRPPVNFYANKNSIDLTQEHESLDSEHV